MTSDQAPANRVRVLDNVETLYVKPVAGQSPDNHTKSGSCVLVSDLC